MASPPPPSPPADENPQSRPRRFSTSSMSTVSDDRDWEVLEPLSPQISPFEEIPPMSTKWVRQIHQMTKDSPQPPQPSDPPKQEEYPMKTATRTLTVLTKLQEPPPKPDADSVPRKTSPPNNKTKDLLFGSQALVSDMKKAREHKSMLPKVERQRRMSIERKGDGDFDERAFCSKEATAIRLKKEADWQTEYTRLKKQEVEQRLEHKTEQQMKPDVQLEKDQVTPEHSGAAFCVSMRQKLNQIKQANENSPNDVDAPLSLVLGGKPISTINTATRQEMIIERDLMLKSHHQKRFERELQMKDDEKKYLEHKKQMEEEARKYEERKKDHEAVLGEMAQKTSSFSYPFEKDYPGSSLRIMGDPFSGLRQTRIPRVKHPKVRQTTDSYHRLTREATTAMSVMSLNGNSEAAPKPAPNDPAKSEASAEAKLLYSTLRETRDWFKSANSG